MTDERNPADVLCDVLLYAPLGFAFEARRLLPELAERGKNQVAAARFLGEIVVQRAGSQLGPEVEKAGRDLGRLVESALGSLGLSIPPLFPVAEPEPTPAAGPEPDGEPGEQSRTASAPSGELGTPAGKVAPAGPAAVQASGAGPSTGDGSSAANGVASGDEAAIPAEPSEAPASPVADALAIPGYDSLAASQVVPRLASLDVDELEAVRAYESSKRGRRTILNRVDQLLEQRRSRGA